MTELESSIIKLRKNGVSVPKISKELKCSRGTVSYHINNHNLGGVRVKKEIESDDSFINKIDKQIINHIIESRENGKTYDEILKNVEISKDKLKKICRIYGLNGHISRNNKVLTNVDINEIRDKYLIFNSVRKVSKSLNYSKSTIIKYCRDLIDLKKNKLRKTTRKEKMVVYVNNFRRKRKKDLILYKGGACQNCGYNKSEWALEFHHINPDEKNFTIGGKNYSLEIMKKEVDKCILVCSNCHKEIHEELNKSEVSLILNKIISNSV